ncbi:UDP-N-acetylmuramate dehydrogenase [Georgenia satyanarayanai]|uniref:UDP-N-acetylenolpyruvoylglucosamine reductase n=1 Tax=Georgenia satyanarayanai TaxID=860221 RepID=A0A2Y9BYD9_9MICO|nr:UDP-N-acetylmuramate dehydrogenase [Georgenia satyanarayanai]PYF99617.1 UDP-N-acetylmuramate dehydrogenase [Georgenia satyanarayanai]SSA42462.1 UDP-N-acetylmuramate dehydrogenase [Georgenia satyanarayanai]
MSTEQPLAGPPTLGELTTFRVGGPVARLVEATSEADLVDTVREADERGRALLVLGGGSNLLASDDGFDGVVVRDARRGIRTESQYACAGVSITVPAGHPWDDVVATAVAEGWRGVEALSGIPGSTGATPVQNVGAYGQEVAETLETVRVYDRLERRTRTLVVSELGLGYRTSVLKRSLTDTRAGGGRTWGPTGRYVVLEVGFQLALGSTSAPVRYAELARALDVEIGARAPAAEVRRAVLELRRGKGMVLDDADPDSWSAGSFFTNPVLTVEQADALLPPDAPRFPVEDRSRPVFGATPPAVPGLVKTSAAWLISRAGVERGQGDPRRAAVSGKHVLALTNRGEASAADVVELARTVRDAVRARFGVDLVPEPVLLGVSL